MSRKSTAPSLCGSTRSTLTRRTARRAARAPSVKPTKMTRPKITSDDFFAALANNSDTIKDFLREMDTPICTSRAVLLPLALEHIATGRCISLSPFGNSSNLGCSCVVCNTTLGGAPARLDADYSDDLRSVAVCFYNNAPQVIANKTFYLSLHTSGAVRQSFLQPSLLYVFSLMRAFDTEITPVFRAAPSGLLTMYALFRTQTLHIKEACVALLNENVLKNYSITLDCTKDTYIMRVTPTRPEDTAVSVAEDEICEAVAQLEFPDELHQILLAAPNLLSSFQ